MRTFGATLTVLAMIGCNNTDDSVLRGTVEVREVDVAPFAVGRVTSVTVDEGATVHRGDTLAVITAPRLAANLDLAEARLATARAVLRDLEAGSDPEQIEMAMADLVALEAEAARLTRDRDRVDGLLSSGAVSVQARDAAQTAAAAAQARVESGRARLALLRAGTRADQLAAARAEVRQAEAALASERASNADYVLLAPIDGVVLARLLEPGDLVSPAGAVVRLGDVTAPWVRVFVPARMLPGITVGDTAAIIPPGLRESGGDRIIGRIVAINPRAEFVTRAALTEEERADLLFGVKVEIADTTQRLKPGMPATVRLFPRVATP
ncbi:MAG: efflux RND transporter periplasmic adaptor subunit [Gemmatimonadales bacterium]|nr:efflux RND transporter periplasmic adaptor subunit [Gemmatimonadales bacterium]MDZ4388619.1 efflux RND transporter periplasmic adaptor subunit [Gemmatimonadales bacterium]